MSTAPEDGLTAETRRVKRQPTVQFTINESMLMVLTDMQFSGLGNWNPATIAPWESHFPQNGTSPKRTGSTLRGRWRNMCISDTFILRDERVNALKWTQTEEFAQFAALYPADPWVAKLPKDFKSLIKKHKLECFFEEESNCIRDNVVIVNKRGIKNHEPDTLPTRKGQCREVT
jgi:hypothetical protein